MAVHAHNAIHDATIAADAATVAWNIVTARPVDIKAQMHDLANAYSVYRDPSSGKLWVTLPDGRCSFDPAAVEIAHAIHAQAITAIPKPITHRGYQLGAPCPSRACPMACHHSKSMPNGLPWDTPQSIGLHIDDWNIRRMTKTLAETLHRQLFLCHEATIPRYGFVDAVLDCRHIEWAFMDTNTGKFKGIAAHCTECEAMARVAWCPRTPSSALHMSLQRQQLCHFLQLDPIAIAPREPLPIV